MSTSADSTHFEILNMRKYNKHGWSIVPNRGLLLLWFSPNCTFGWYAAVLSCFECQRFTTYGRSSGTLVIESSSIAVRSGQRSDWQMCLILSNKWTYTIYIRMRILCKAASYNWMRCKQLVECRLQVLFVAAPSTRARQTLCSVHSKSCRHCDPFVGGCSLKYVYVNFIMRINPYFIALNVVSASESNS